MSKHVGEKCGKWADGDQTDGESDGRMDGRTDGDPDGDPDGHHHTIIRPVFRRVYNYRTDRHTHTKQIKIYHMSLVNAMFRW